MVVVKDVLRECDLSTREWGESKGLETMEFLKSFSEKLKEVARYSCLFFYLILEGI